MTEERIKTAPTIRSDAHPLDWVPPGWTPRMWLKRCEYMVRVTTVPATEAEWQRRVEALTKEQA
jgi:hypothetical protein